MVVIGRSIDSVTVTDGRRDTPTSGVDGGDVVPAVVPAFYVS